MTQRVKISSIIQNQVPEYVKEEYPLAVEFLRQYYTSLEGEGNTYDILQNIDHYVNVDNLVNYETTTNLLINVSYFDDTIFVTSTAGFPEKNGLIKINDEIILYKSKTTNSFVNCVRGFSGVTSYSSIQNPEELVFSESDSSEHTANDLVENLNANLLKEFFRKLKTLVAPGFENKDFFSGLNESLFVKQSGDFYRSKGTDTSFKILFGALYGKKVEVIKPKDYLIEPSAAQYRITRDFVVEAIEGDPITLVNTTLYQDEGVFKKSSGTITNVEKILRGDKTFYVVSLDFEYNRDISVTGTVFGDFNIHPKTKVTNTVSTFDTTIDVDSTVGFPTSGDLIFTLDNGSQFLVNYTSKSINQFYGCSGILEEIPSGTEAPLDAFAYGFNIDGDQVKVRITGVLSDVNVLSPGKYFDKDQTIKINNLGYSAVDERLNNWFYNCSIIYNVKSIELVDNLDFSYRITLYDVPALNLGDSITLISNDGEKLSQILIEQGSVISFNDKNSFIIGGQGELDTNLQYQIRKNILRPNLKNYPSAEIFQTNIQNAYYDLNDDSVYVAASSIPSYNQANLETKDGGIDINVNFSGSLLNVGPHYFYTGDLVSFLSYDSNNTTLPNGIYFVKRETETTIRLAKSRNNIDTETYFDVNGSVYGKLEFFKFTDSNYNKKPLDNQKLVRRVKSSPVASVEKQQTSPGPVGILNNGVEIFSYKAKETIFYGNIEEVIPTANGEGYDVINPPIITISDSTGSGAIVYPGIVGKLEEIQVIDSGFDYIDEPQIIISGGNGVGAAAKANLIEFVHEVLFDGNSGVNISTNVITTDQEHKFRDNEQVIYSAEGQSQIGGLISGSTYYINILEKDQLRLYPSFEDSVNQTNSIDLTTLSFGKHSFRSVVKKKKIRNITVESQGSNYRNKRNITSPVGVNTASNIISLPNHDFVDLDIVEYSTTGAPIGGLSTTSYYYAKKVDADNIRIVAISTGAVKEEFYNNNIFVDLTSSGSGLHQFNHQPITVNVSGSVGVSSYSSVDSQAIIQPIFSGSIQSVSIETGGSDYGSPEIINYNKQPLFLINTGSTAQVRPIISNGQIVEVIVLNSGSNYNTPPNLVINGSGSGAVLTPVINSGLLEDVIVVSGGGGYIDGKTSIDVIQRGSGAKFEAKIKSWRINLVERLFNSTLITGDDGVIVEPINEAYGIQYSHLYAPRKLREAVLAKKNNDGNVFFKSDILSDYSNLRYHSPIIGWSYDGHPIYGPYGYISPEGGEIKALESGYDLILTENRPPLSLYPLGFFVEDYQFKNSGDLDEHNGRFCITPEFPNGTYAYFCTINPQAIEDGGIYNDYRKPVFPYVIGDTYNSLPDNFNYLSASNQDEIDFNQTKWLRNTTYYNIFSENSDYEFISNPNKIKPQNSKIKSIKKGYVEFIDVIASGSNYAISDKVTIGASDSADRRAKAKIAALTGKEVTLISVATTSVQNMEVIPYEDKFIGIASLPHNFNENDVVTVTTNFEYNTSQSIGISTNTLTLTQDILPTSVTGIVTYFSVSGNLDFPVLKENDYYLVNNEQIKVINIDKVSSRIRVERNQNFTAGVSTHFSGTYLRELPNKAFLNFEANSEYNYNVNREFYFIPSETLGIGTGIGHTLSFSNPGAGATTLVIPSRTLYLPSHDLKTGTELIYNSNGGSPISISTDGIANSSLTNGQSVYVAKITNDLIGLGLTKVGLGTTGQFVGISDPSAGLLYFTGIGTGPKHSFKTNYTSNIIATLSKNVVTVATTEPHGLIPNDTVNVSCISGITTSIVVEYNDFNRRLILNPITFASSDVDISNNTIKLKNHNLRNNQRVVYTAAVPAGGLVNEKIYYVVYVDNDHIKLSEAEFKLYNPIDVVNITTATGGRILPINPPIEIIKNSTVEFNLSSSTLAFIENEVPYSAFELVFYTDATLKNRFDSSSTSQVFEVSRLGSVGIDADAKVVLTINDNIPNILYYNLVPIDTDRNSSIKTEIIVDDLVSNSNKINIIPSGYSGAFKVKTTTTNAFTFDVELKPEKDSYFPYEAEISYSTNSITARGGIDSIKVISNNVGYSKLPTVSVSSTTGTGSILFAGSNTIGAIQKIEIEDIGFDYNCDLTVRPTSSLPTIIKVEPLSSFDTIGITSSGKNYTSAPSLVVIDSFTNKVVDDVDLDYSLGDSKVTILKNTKGFYNTNPLIIPTGNSNGIPIKNINFNIVNNDVIVTLGASFSDPETFPFAVGDRVIIENIVVTGNDPKGYNSSNYNYQLFELTNIDSNISGIAVTVAYNLSGYLNGNEVPGTFDSVNSYGRIIPEKDFPIFDIKLKKNNFFVGERAYSNNSEGIVELWDKDNEYLKISSTDKFEKGQLITGRTSSSSGIINSVLYVESVYDVDPSSVVIKGWKNETGFLNNTLQRLADNDYYQYFSYSLKSDIDYSNWNETVYNLNHTAGFKRFGDLVINSIADGFAGISTVQDSGSFDVITDLYSTVSTNCYYDFDLVRENNVTIDGQLFSNFIDFNSRILQNYIESIGNRVLTIDDISGTFNNVPRVDLFSNIEIERLTNYRSKKYLTFVQDVRFRAERQALLVTLIHNGSFGYINQYAGVDTAGDLGTFDFSVVGDEAYFQFYPTKNQVNDYDVNYSFYSIEDSIAGIGTTTLGRVSTIQSQTKSFGVGIGTTISIVSVASTQIAAKALIQISATDGSFYEYNEISFTNNGTDVAFIDYGQLVTSNNSPYSSSGIGTYGVILDGSGMSVTLKPNNSLTTSINVNSVIVSIASTAYSGVGTVAFDNSAIESFEKTIPASGSPGVTTIASYSTDSYSAAYYIISVKDNTNNQTQISEIVACNNDSDVNWVDFGFAETQSTLGIITAGITTSKVHLYFTPNANIQTRVVVYQHSIGLLNILTPDSTIDLTNASIGNGTGEYEGAQSAVKRDFNLTSQGRDIFQRTFNPQKVGIVNTSTDTIRIPENFFVTGEKVTYSFGLNGGPIGIASTFITGIGTTTSLPSTVYVVKINDLDIKVSASASEALLPTPKTLDLTSVGIGTEHTLTATQQNSKVLVSLDNIIQSPVVATGRTTSLQSNLLVSDTVVKVVNTFGFTGGDLIQIDDEIMRISIVGFGSTGYLLVDRPWFGTGISTHFSGSLVTKVSGNYNILGNTISFADAPYGPTPVEVIDGSDPYGIDYAGIQTSMTFSGRVFTRSGVPNSINDTYSTNYIFNDISSNFTGINSIFTLTQGSSNVTGVTTDNAIILYNDVLQTPNRNSIEPIEGNYEIIESGGISSIRFNGYAPIGTYDINQGTYPRGGVIVSIGSTQGFGYQPLVSAGGTAIISIAGTISTISIGNTGSGYRAKRNFVVETTTTGITTVGFTTIFVNNLNSVFGIINASNTGSNCKVSIGSYIQNATINTVNTNNLVISTAATVAIPANALVQVSITDPAVGTINVGVANSSNGISTVTHIGYSQIANGRINSVVITNPGIGYTRANPPKIVFENPLPYSDIPVKYSISSPSGVGTGAKLDVIVGQGSSVINFDFTNLGYAYNINDILTFDINGVFGIPTNSSLPFSEFQITVEQVYDDKFTGWVIGSLQILDPIDTLFDGQRTVFPISIDGERFTIKAKPGSNIDVKSTLIITINGVLQVPGESFIFDGGSTIRFTEAPKAGDTSTLMFYRGTSEVDTKPTDILESVKVGDKLTIDSDDPIYEQNSRTVVDITATDLTETNLYPGPGISLVADLARPVTLCYQLSDTTINGESVTKDREIYDFNVINPATLIKKINSQSTEIFVDNGRPYLSSVPTAKNVISFISNTAWTPALATAIVSTAGTISSIPIADGGSGYTTTPSVTISYPIGFGTTLAASAVAGITSGIVTSITVVNPGIGYSTINPPQVLIEPPIKTVQKIDGFTYQGDFGYITGIAATSIVGIATTGLAFDFHIPLTSYLRDPNKVGTAITISGIQTGYYFMVKNSNVGNASTSYDENNQIIGIGTTYLDNVYRVAKVSIASSTIAGVGATFVARVVVSVSNNQFSGIQTNYYGDYTWGRISGFNEVISNELLPFYNQ